MEGIKRLTIIGKDLKPSKIRLPLTFKDLKSQLSKISGTVPERIEILHQSTLNIISDSASYNTLLSNSSGQDLIVNLSSDPSPLNADNKYLLSLPQKRPAPVRNHSKLSPQEDYEPGASDRQEKRLKKIPSTKNRKISNSEVYLNKEIDVLNSFSCIQQEGEIKIIDSKTSDSLIISDESIKKSSRLLLTNEGVLVTGGSGADSNAMMIKKDYSISTLQNMNKGRFWHCMGFIDGCPAVAGGAKLEVGLEFTNTVEVYKGDKWVNYPSTNLSRASASMSWNNQNVFIIGGVTTDGQTSTFINYIEKWDNNQWVILNVVIPTSLISCGSLPAGKNILIFGGQSSSGSQSQKKFILNTEDGSVKEEKDLATEMKFTYGQEVKILENSFKVCDYSGKVLEIEYDNIELD